MLGLGDEVGGDALGVAGFAGDDDFGGSGGHVDAGFVGDGDLGGGDVEIAGADNLHDGFNGATVLCCPVGHGGHGLRAADAVELGDAGKVGGGHGFTHGFGAADDDALDARDLGGGGGHEQGGGQRVAAAGDVAAYRFERADDLADLHALLRAEAPGLGHLFFGKGADVGLGEAHGGLELFGGVVPGGLHLLAGDDEGLIGAEAVEADGVFADAFVAALADLGEDFVDDGVDLGGGDGAALFDLLDGGFGRFGAFAVGLEDLHGSAFRYIG